MEHGRIQRGARGPDPPPPPQKKKKKKNHKNIGFLSNTAPDPLKNHRATKPAFNVGPYNWCFAGGTIMVIVVFGSSIPSSTKNRGTLSNWTPLWQNILDPRMWNKKSLKKLKRGPSKNQYCVVYPEVREMSFEAVVVQNGRTPNDHSSTPFKNLWLRWAINTDIVHNDEIIRLSSAKYNCHTQCYCSTIIWL